MTDRHQATAYPLRLPADLKAKVEAAAAAQGRSLNSEISARLAASFEAPAAFQRASPLSALLTLTTVLKWFSVSYQVLFHKAPLDVQADYERDVKYAALFSGNPPPDLREQLTEYFEGHGDLPPAAIEHVAAVIEDAAMARRTENALLGLNLPEPPRRITRPSLARGPASKVPPGPNYDVIRENGAIKAAQPRPLLNKGPVPRKKKP